MSNQCIQVTMSSLKKLLRNVSPEVVVSIRGRHAVGKSEAVAQFAAEMGLPLQMRRLSQMTEGDLLGLPSEVKTSGGSKATTFNPCEWFIEACEKPMVLFLDERNRALDAVKQAIFEICDSRQFYGHKLHAQTRVIIAENVGDSYQVQACDPAEVSRTVTVELEPSVAEWLDYAKTKCNEATIDFIRQEGEKALEFRGQNGAYEPNKKYPDRRSWIKLDSELNRNGMFETPESVDFAVMASGFLGTEIGNKFQNFCKNRERQVSAKDVLADWKKAKARLSSNGKREITNEKYVEITKKLGDFLTKKDPKTEIGYKPSMAEATQFAGFFADCPPEPRLALYSDLTANHDALMILHPAVSNYNGRNLVLDTVVGVVEAKEAAEKAKEATTKKK